MRLLLTTPTSATSTTPTSATAATATDGDAASVHTWWEILVVNLCAIVDAALHNAFKLPGVLLELCCCLLVQRILRIGILKLDSSMNETTIAAASSHGQNKMAQSSSASVQHVQPSPSKTLKPAAELLQHHRHSTDKPTYCCQAPTSFCWQLREADHMPGRGTRHNM